MSASVSSDDGGMRTNIDVTPLIDVMCALLISFMVTAPLMGQKTAKVEVPFAEGVKLTEEDFVVSVLSVDAQGNVFLGVTPLSKDKAALTSELANNVLLKETKRVFLQGDSTVPYEKIVDVLVALKEAGITNVGLLTDPRLSKAGDNP